MRGVDAVDYVKLLLLEENPSPRFFQIEPHAASVGSDVAEEDTELIFRLLQLTEIHGDANEVVLLFIFAAGVSAFRDNEGPVFLRRNYEQSVRAHGNFMATDGNRYVGKERHRLATGCPYFVIGDLVAEDGFLRVNTEALVFNNNLIVCVEVAGRGCLRSCALGEQYRCDEELSGENQEANKPRHSEPQLMNLRSGHSLMTTMHIYRIKMHIAIVNNVALALDNHLYIVRRYYLRMTAFWAQTLC